MFLARFAARGFEVEIWDWTRHDLAALERSTPAPGQPLAAGVISAGPVRIDELEDERPDHYRK